MLGLKTGGVGKTAHKNPQPQADASSLLPAHLPDTRQLSRDEGCNELDKQTLIT